MPHTHIHTFTYIHRNTHACTQAHTHIHRYTSFTPKQNKWDMILKVLPVLPEPSPQIVLQYSRIWEEWFVRWTRTANHRTIAVIWARRLEPYVQLTALPKLGSLGQSLWQSSALDYQGQGTLRPSVLKTPNQLGPSTKEITGSSAPKVTSSEIPGTGPGTVCW